MSDPQNTGTPATPITVEKTWRVGEKITSPECKAAAREVVDAIQNKVDLSALNPKVEAACSVDIQCLGAIQMFSENQRAHLPQVPAVVEKAKQCMRNAKPD
jgi:hypothetical protein